MSDKQDFFIPNKEKPVRLRFMPLPNGVDKTQLRIGNLVKNTNLMTVRINEMNIGKFHLEIPLDDSQLLFLGMKRLDKYSFYKNGFFIHKRKRGYVLKKGAPLLTTVHQVQNLYFALKGKEMI